MKNQDIPGQQNVTHKDTQSSEQQKDNGAALNQGEKLEPVCRQKRTGCCLIGAPHAGYPWKCWKRLDAVRIVRSFLHPAGLARRWPSNGKGKFVLALCGRQKE